MKKLLTVLIMLITGMALFAVPVIEAHSGEFIAVNTVGAVPQADGFAIVTDTILPAETDYSYLINKWCGEFEQGRLSKSNFIRLVKAVIALEEIRGIKNLGLYKAGCAVEYRSKTGVFTR